MPRSARLLVLALAALSFAASAAFSVTTLQASGATPVDAPIEARPSTQRAHQALAPSRVAVARPVHRTKPARAVAPPVRKPVAAPRKSRPAPVASAPRVRRASLTPKQLMLQAIARLPHHRPGDGTFILKPGLSNWGIADLTNGIVYISPKVPAKRMYDVVAHEWAHVLSMGPYDSDVQVALDAMNSYFGGSGLTGAERAADCMALELGAKWTHYTSCTKASWRTGARRLLAGQAV